MGAVAVCGHLCLDIIPGFRQSARDRDFFKPGTLSVVDAPVITTGGAVPNVGFDLHRMGVQVTLIARIGDDTLGKLVLERITREGSGLARRIMTVPGGITSYTVVLSPPGVDRIFLHCPGVNEGFTESDVTDDALEECSILYVGYPPLLKTIYADGKGARQAVPPRPRARGF